MPNVQLDFKNVYGETPKNRAVLTVIDQATSRQILRQEFAMNRPLAVNFEYNGTFRFEIRSVQYRPVRRFVTVYADKTESFTVAIDPKAVSDSGVRFPRFNQLDSRLQDLLNASAAVEGRENVIGAALYDGLENIPKAGLLNIHAKAVRTLFAEENSVADYLTGLRRLRGDRIFSFVKPELRDRVKDAVSKGVFSPVSGALHAPPPEFRLVDSYKTEDRAGNLHLTFFQHVDRLEFIADLDIDEASGFAHVFEVLGNALTGKATHPYDIHQLLLRTQRIDSGFRLSV